MFENGVSLNPRHLSMAMTAQEFQMYEELRKERAATDAEMAKKAEEKKADEKEAEQKKAEESLTPEELLEMSMAEKILTPEELQEKTTPEETPKPEEGCEKSMAEESLTPEELLDELSKEQLVYQAVELRKHMGLPGSVGGPELARPTITALFFIENAAGRASCQLATCEDCIEPGNYRVALTPSLSGSYWTTGRPGSVGTFCCMVVFCQLSILYPSRILS